MILGSYPEEMRVSVYILLQQAPFLKFSDFSVKFFITMTIQDIEPRTYCSVIAKIWWRIHRIAFYPNKLGQHEIHWPLTENVTNHQARIRGTTRPFDAYTDNSACRWMLHHSKVSPKLARFSSPSRQRVTQRWCGRIIPSSDVPRNFFAAFIVCMERCVFNVVQLVVVTFDSINLMNASIMLRCTWSSTMWTIGERRLIFECVRYRKSMDTLDQFHIIDTTIVSTHLWTSIKKDFKRRMIQILISVLYGMALKYTIPSNLWSWKARCICNQITTVNAFVPQTITKLAKT